MYAYSKNLQNIFYEKNAQKQLVKLKKNMFGFEIIRDWCFFQETNIVTKQIT